MSLKVRSWSALLVAAGLAMAGCSSGSNATAIGGSFVFTSPGGKSEFTYAVAQRKPLNELSGPDLSGTKTISLSDYPGKIVVINFWGSWCPPCRDEAGGFQDAWMKLQSHGVQFIGIDVRDQPGAGAAFDADKQITYPSIYDFGLRTLLSIRGYPTGAIPSTIVLDKQHRVAHIWLIEINEGELTDVVTALTAES